MDFKVYRLPHALLPSLCRRRRAGARSPGVVGGVRYRQPATARSPAPAPLTATDAPATGAAHDPAAHSAGPGAAEERTASSKWHSCHYTH